MELTDNELAAQMDERKLAKKAAFAQAVEALYVEHGMSLMPQVYVTDDGRLAAHIVVSENPQGVTP